MNALLAFGLHDAVWYVAAAAGAAIMLALIAGFRHFGRWCRRRTRTAFLEAFGEAIDKHVEPKFKQLRDESAIAAEEVKEDLRQHTAEEGEVVRQVVNEAIEPIMRTLNDRIDLVSNLDRLFERVGQELKAGQDELLHQLQSRSSG